MKKITIIILFLVASIKLIAVDVTLTDATILKFDSWKNDEHTEFVRQFIVPIEKDGVNLNTRIIFTVSDVNSNWGLSIRNYITLCFNLCRPILRRNLPKTTKSQLPPQIPKLLVLLNIHFQSCFLFFQN